MQLKGILASLSEM